MAEAPEKIRVLQLVTSFIRFRGDDSFNFEYMKRLVKKGVSIDVIVPHDRENSLGFEEVEGIRIHRFHYFFPKSLQRVAYHGGVAFNLANSQAARLQFPLFMLSYFLKSLRNVRGKDIIHAQWVPSGLVALALKAITGKPVVLWIHRMVPGKGLQKKLTKLVLERCDFVMFNSSYTMGIAKKLARMNSFALMPPSVDEAIFKPIKNPGMRKRLGIAPGAKVVFALGRFVEKKGFCHLIEAMTQVKARDAVCVIAGYGPLEEKMKALVKEKGLEGKVLFAGMVPNADVPLWMNEAELVVVPSIVDSSGETETLGIVAIEAIACGKPVVASRVGGLVDVVKDGFNGFLVKQKDSSELAERINRLLASPGLVEKMSRNARLHAEENFSWNKMVDRTIEVYGKLLKK